MKRKLLTVLLGVLCAVCLALGLVACGPGEGGGTKITLSQTSLTLYAEGSSEMITATVSGSTETVEWKTSDETVISLMPLANTCLVMPMKEGTATLTASIDEVSAICTVTVGPAAEVEVVTIYKDGSNVTGTELSVEEEHSLTLTATGSLNSAINWSSSDESIASVENGVVTGHRPGTVTITAYVTPSIYSTVTVTVNAPAGTVYYDLLFGWDGNPENKWNEEDESTPIPDNTFYYWASRTGWGQQVDIEHAYYRNGTVYIKYTSDWDPGYWYGFQLHYYGSQYEANKYYKFTCKINVDYIFFDEQEQQSCIMNIGGVLTELKKGENDVTVYFKAGEKFTIMTGYDLLDGSNGYFVKDIEFSIGDMVWTEDTGRVQLSAPSFEYNTTTKVISITDSNAAGVGRYMLNFYNGSNAKVASVAVEDGKAVDTSTVPNGTYTVKLVAEAESTHYIDSAESATTASITVENETVHYELAATGAAGAVANPGIWTYYASTWVEFSEKSYTDGVVTFNFTNNSGNWDDTQLYYYEPSAEAGKYYTFELTITSDVEGHIVISGHEILIEKGTQTYKIENFRQNAGDATVAIIFALYGQTDGAQEITSGNFKISLTSFVEVEGSAGGGDQGGGGGEGAGQDGAVATPGSWTYWTSEWVENFTFSPEGTAVTITFANNKGFWYDTQLFYRVPNAVAGTYYDITLTITSTVGGRITICDQVITIESGTHTYTVKGVLQAEAGATVVIVFGVLNENDGKQDIQAATVTVVYEGITAGEAPEIPEIPEGELGYDKPAALAHPGRWAYWTSDWVDFSGSEQEGVVTITFSNNKGNWYDTQLFYLDPNAVVGTYYNITLTITTTVGGRITICGQVITLQSGTHTYTVQGVLQAAGDATVTIVFGVVDENEKQEIQAATVSVKLDSITANGSATTGSGSGGGSSLLPPASIPEETNVALALDSVYGGDEYFFFWATTDVDITTAAKVSVNGSTVEWVEYTKSGDGRYAFRVKVGNTTLSAYVFEWTDADGNAIATAVYQQ